MDTSQQTQPKPKQACDNCRRRKIRCSREIPCDKCQRLLLKCSYSDILRRKGPKFRTLYPLAPSHPLVSRQLPLDEDEMVQQDNNNGSGYSADGSAEGITPEASTLQYRFPQLVTSPPEFSSTDSDYSSSQGQGPRPYARRLTSPILLAHINVYLKYLFPIMPVVRREELQRDSDHPERVSAQRYAFLAALCATTHIQLKLDGGESPDGRAHLMSGEELLTEAVRARDECDVVEEMDVEGLLTSFFLFASYGNLDRQRQAWFYLCQANSMAFALGLHRESTYRGLSVEEAEEKRRVFWLLFVTERGYALQQAKPVMLRSSINKPQVLCSDDPILAYGFINLINLFEKITPNLYDWVSAGGSSHNETDNNAASSIQSTLCNSPIASLRGVLEIQQVDILITQQWLQAMMWKLSMDRARPTGNGSRNTSSSAMLPFHLPIVVGKSVLSVIGAASQGAVDAHGIGMEQKLYDLGTTIAKVANNLYNFNPSTTTPPTTTPNTKPKTKQATANALITHLTESTIEPRELLWGILTTLSRIRGSQSYLFPCLLEECQGVLGMECSITMGNHLPSFTTTTTGVGVGGSGSGGNGLGAYLGPGTGTGTGARTTGDISQEDENNDELSSGIGYHEL